MSDGESPEDSLISVFGVNGEEPEDGDVSVPILEDWDLLSINGEGFELQLNFTNAILVSSNEKPDLLLI